MDGMLIIKILTAVMFGYFIWKMMPVARNQLKHGPKGSSNDWMATAMLLGGVVGFVVLLIMMVRSN